jgi:hypothetical protein
MRKMLFGLVMLAAAAGRADAGLPVFPPTYDAQSGRFGPTGRNPITLDPVTHPKFQPVVGSVTRTHHFANPFTHRARYAGDAMEPSSGRLFRYKFKQ